MTNLVPNRKLYKVDRKHRIVHHKNNFMNIYRFLHSMFWIGGSYTILICTGIVLLYPLDFYSHGALLQTIAFGTMLISLFGYITVTKMVVCELPAYSVYLDIKKEKEKNNLLTEIPFLMWLIFEFVYIAIWAYGKNGISLGKVMFILIAIYILFEVVRKIKKFTTPKKIELVM